MDKHICPTCGEDCIFCNPCMYLTTKFSYDCGYEYNESGYFCNALQCDLGNIHDYYNNGSIAEVHNGAERDSECIKHKLRRFKEEKCQE